MRRFIFASCLLAAASLFPASADAQSQSLFGNRGPLGQSGAGGRASSISNQLGGGAGAGAGAGGGLGQTGANQSGLSSGVSVPAELGALSNTIGQGFVGRADNLGTFVGNRMAGEQAAPSFGRGPAGLGGLGNRGGIQSFQPEQPQQERAPIRPQLRIGFEFSSRSSSAVQTSLATRWEKIALRALPSQPQIEFHVDADGEVVLRGEVATERARALAESFVRLEPGVRRVHNELTVAPAAE